MKPDRMMLALWVIAALFIISIIITGINSVLVYD